MPFSEALRQLRKQDKLTQAELASAIGISKSTISMYECGNREPDFETLEALADFFNVDMNKLTGTSSPSCDSRSCTNIIKIAARDGSYTEKHLTDDQVKALRLILDQMPDAEDL